ncbi:hypothetical protein AMATHDRAFT_69278 [Amanita thiersii Skay4041]|uniref:Uncharacterized protein n=1 Tax=Amanita thiersii Skay4041 TaxID=703135 RepID=A0A2A9NG39_9AGAR|nr:hypothetical protein AMATHDRAFT_69278 [Amanita thiersii Skay4041]
MTYVALVYHCISLPSCTDYHTAGEAIMLIIVDRLHWQNDMMQDHGYHLPFCQCSAMSLADSIIISQLSNEAMHGPQVIDGMIM